jgi:hypothetical protein
MCRYRFFGRELCFIACNTENCQMKFNKDMKEKNASMMHTELAKEEQSLISSALDKGLLNNNINNHNNFELDKEK